MLTEQRLNDAINNLIARFNGQYIGFPDGNYHGECTAPIVWLNQDLGIPVPPMWNARADGWGVSFPSQLAPYFNHESYQAGTAYPRGSIMLWNSPHIAIVLHSDGSNIVQVFEQNADPNGAPCQTTNRVVTDSYHQCTYVLTPILQAPAPVPTPARYDIIQTYEPGKQIKLNKQPTFLWGMNYHFDYRKDHPIETHSQGEIWTVTNKVRSEEGNDYYRRDGQVDGFHVDDCDDYTPPVYKPPAAPVPVPKAPKVKLETAVPYYITAQTAQSGYKSIGTLQPRDEDYYQISTDLGMLNLSTDNMKDAQQWINPRDNRLPEPVKIEVKPLPQPTPLPAPEAQSTAVTPWFNKVEWFNVQHLPVSYLITKATTIRDYSRTRPEVYPLEIGHELKVYGTITDPSNTKYYLSKLPKADAEFQYRYSVPMVDPETGRALLLKKATKSTRNRDHLQVIKSELEEMNLPFLDIVPRFYKRLETKIIKKG